MSWVAALLYAPLLAAGVAAVWRRPVLALYAFVVGLALHNVVVALLYAGGVRGAPLTAIQAWKEALLATALAAVAFRARGLPFRPGRADVLALAFAGVVLAYAVVPQSWLGGAATPEGIVLSVRHALLPVLAYLLGRSLALGAEELRRLGAAVLATAGAVAAIGIVEVYAVPLDWWRDSGIAGWYRDQLGFEYRGLSGLPENFVFNTGDEQRPLRRLLSTFLSPLGTAFMLAVALLLVAARPTRRTLALAPLLVAALLLTHTRGAFLALTGGLVVLAAVRRDWRVAVAAPAFLALSVAFVSVFPAIGPETRFTPEEIEVQRQIREERGPAVHDPLDLQEPSVQSHLMSLREGFETVAEQPQGYGLGNAGATASRTGAPLRAGESNYAELGVETGVLGLALFVVWNLLLFVALARGGRRDVVAAWLAAALATVLALAVQTDAYGVPWLAYCVWGLCGAAAVAPRAEAPAAEAAPRRRLARLRSSSPGSVET
ncbi:MAG TPA: O-antigen ligase family protein [Gaiellaceae bacterium]|nr:O-antigen ligase family protein [Gaiellaceae bacterium]